MAWRAVVVSPRPAKGRGRHGETREASGDLAWRPCAFPLGVGRGRHTGLVGRYVRGTYLQQVQPLPSAPEGGHRRDKSRKVSSPSVGDAVGDDPGSGERLSGRDVAGVCG
ncbi:hypothetical protein GCM10010350_82520 [Streptomyces galilaeus]|nr:hypothetical protein GCM10010350_82520 [Streptomyces galilaeus]